MTIEQGAVNNRESEFAGEQELFEVGTVRLAENFEAFAELSSAQQPVSGELEGKFEMLRNFLQQKENVLVLAILLGNLGSSLWNYLPSEYSVSNYGHLRDALKGLGLEDALASFRARAPKFIPKIKEVLAEENE